MLRSSEFKNMEVINLSNNERLGYVCDFEICISNGEISAIIVPDKTKFFLSNKGSGFRIPWSNISAIGKDIILVNIEIDE